MKSLIKRILGITELESKIEKLETRSNYLESKINMHYEKQNTRIEEIMILHKNVNFMQEKLNKDIENLEKETHRVKQINKVFKMGGEVSPPQDGGTWAIVFHNTKSNCHVKYYEFQNANDFIHMAQSFERKDIDSPSGFLNTTPSQQ